MLFCLIQLGPGDAWFAEEPNRAIHPLGGGFSHAEGLFLRRNDTARQPAVYECGANGL